MFILASKSPRRKEILKQLIPSFEVIVSNVNEAALIEMVAPKDLAKAEALLKARSIIKSHPNDMVLSADTVVLVDNKPLGKPKDEKEAFEMLRFQSGKKQEVITGYVFYDGKETIVDEDITSVYFNKLSDEQITEYIKKYQPFDKAGAYGIQDEAGLISKIEGSYSNVMGLPEEALKKLFLKKGII